MSSSLEEWFQTAPCDSDDGNGAVVRRRLLRADKSLHDLTQHIIMTKSMQWKDWVSFLIANNNNNNNKNNKEASATSSTGPVWLSPK